MMCLALPHSAIGNSYLRSGQVWNAPARHEGPQQLLPVPLLLWGNQGSGGSVRPGLHPPPSLGNTTVARWLIKVA